MKSAPAIGACSALAVIGTACLIAYLMGGHSRPAAIDSPSSVPVVLPHLNGASECSLELLSLQSLEGSGLGRVDDRTGMNSEGKCVFRGTVYYGDDLYVGQPIAIHHRMHNGDMGSSSTTTNAKGAFVMDSRAPEGRGLFSSLVIDLRPTSNGGRPVECEYEYAGPITAGVNQLGEITIPRPPLVASGVVVDSSGDPVEGAILKFS